MSTCQEWNGVLLHQSEDENVAGSTPRGGSDLDRVRATVARISCSNPTWNKLNRLNFRNEFGGDTEPGH